MGRIRSTTKADAAAVYDVPNEADDALHNWARWASPRHGVKRRLNASFSLVKPDRWGDNTARETAPAAFAAAVDPEAAWAAEKVLCNPMFWPPARTMLTQHYLYRASERATCRLLGIHGSQYSHDLWRAACMFWNQYQKRASHVSSIY